MMIMVVFHTRCTNSSAVAGIHLLPMGMRVSPMLSLEFSLIICQYDFECIFLSSSCMSRVLNSDICIALLLLHVRLISAAVKRPLRSVETAWLSSTSMKEICSKKPIIHDDLRTMNPRSHSILSSVLSSFGLET
jgi:hypothetical protein